MAKPKQGLKQKFRAVFVCGLFFHQRVATLDAELGEWRYGCPRCGSWWVAYI